MGMNKATIEKRKIRVNAFNDMTKRKPEGFSVYEYVEAYPFLFDNVKQAIDFVIGLRNYNESIQIRIENSTNYYTVADGMHRTFHKLMHRSHACQ